MPKKKASKFHITLKNAAEEVATWPKWKIYALGNKVGDSVWKIIQEKKKKKK